MEIKTVRLIGLGAMGVFFAPRLYETLGPERFAVIAGGARAERLRTRGVTVNGKEYRFPIVAPEQAESADLILIATKHMDLSRAIEDIRAHVGENTQILCVMNGVDSEEQLAAAFGREHVLYSFMRMSIVMTDGRADFDPYWGKVHFGEARNEAPLSPRVAAVRRLFEKCDIPCAIDEDMVKGMWFKYMCNIGENMTCALLGIPFGFFRWCDGANAIRVSAMREVAAIAQRAGVDIGEREIREQQDTIRTLPYENKPSTLQDLEHGRKTEIEMLAGTVVRLGEKYGIDTPVNRLFYNGIRALEDKNARGTREPK